MENISTLVGFPVIQDNSKVILEMKHYSNFKIANTYNRFNARTVNNDTMSVLNAKIFRLRKGEKNVD